MTPVIEGTKCKLAVYAIFAGLNIAPLIIGLYIWYAYDWMIGIGVILFLYIVSSIVSSKMRLSALPPTQLEHSFSAYEIAQWYVHRHLFCND